MGKNAKGVTIADVGNYAKKPVGCQQVFSNVGPWEFETVIHDNTTIYTLTQTRNCTNGTLGQPRGCSGAKERSLTYFWIHENLTFFEARENCHNMSAILFDQFTGKIDLLNFLFKHMLPAHVFWVGVEHDTSSEYVDRLISEDGQTMHWRIDLSKESSTNDEDRFLSMNYEYSEEKSTPRQVFYKMRGNETLPSVCYRFQTLTEF